MYRTLLTIFLLMSFVVPAIPQTGHYVDLTWNPVVWNDPIKYRVYRSKNCTGGYVRKHATKSTSWTDVYVSAGVTYCYVVTAYDTVTGKGSGYSNVVMVTIPSP